VLGRFLSADSIVPDAGNPQAFNRYAYALNSPLRYTDPTGHMVACNPMEDDCHNEPPAAPVTSLGGFPSIQVSDSPFDLAGLPVVGEKHPSFDKVWNRYYARGGQTYQENYKLTGPQALQLYKLIAEETMPTRGDYLKEMWAELGNYVLSQLPTSDAQDILTKIYTLALSDEYSKAWDRECRSDFARDVGKAMTTKEGLQSVTVMMVNNAQVIDSVGIGKLGFVTTSDIPIYVTGVDPRKSVVVSHANATLLKQMLLAIKRNY
jgi:hypothetical protein